MKQQLVGKSKKYEFMKNISSKKGFTLIELLIVIAIIGILAAALLVSLGGARRSARDARRISDLRNVQAALELYFNKCGKYPGDQICGTVGTNPIGPWTSGGTGELDDVLMASGLGISKIPFDPVGGGTQDYYYGVDTTANQNQKYVLRAKLDLDNQVLSDDLDGTQYGQDC
ncbi:MAG TPA: prepilin-type N-terminal cleavage/methylation domain-containing protein, partial [Candidatus Paceibacterota bacterium]